MIYFKKLSIRNFLSYGNIPTTIILDSHPKTLICSPNGMGKCVVGSSILRVKYLEGIFSIKIEDLFNYEYNISSHITYVNSAKFLETVSVKDIFVDTDSGWQPIIAIHQIRAERPYEVICANGYRLIGAAHHLVYVESMVGKPLCQLKKGKDSIFTKEGFSSVVGIHRGLEPELLYDITVDDNNHRYFVNGILSHNTAIPTALLFGLFGKTHRKVNLPQLVNSINGGDCVVEVEFSVGLKDTYKIRRGLKPSFLELTKNELPIPLSCNSELQDIIEKQILKTDFRTFSSIIIIGGKNQLPFMSFKKQDRRQIIESLLDIDIFSSMNTIAKEESLVLQEVVRSKQIEVNSKTNELDLLKSTIKRYQQSIQQSSVNKQDQLTQYRLKVQDLDEQLQQINQQLTNLYSTFGHLDTLNKTFIDKITQLKSVTSDYQKRIKRVREQIAFYQKNELCPTCEQPLNEEYRSTLITQLQDKVIKLTEKLTTIGCSLQELSDSHTEIKTSQQEVNRLVNQKERCLQDKEKFMSIIEELDKPVDDVILNSLVEDEQKLLAIYDVVLSLKKDLDGLREEQEYLDFCQLLLKDNGVKTLIIKEYLPKINETLNKYLDDLDLLVDFHFDENFNELIRSRYRELFSYDSFSDGQKMRIDIALLFTWREIARQKNSLNTNILICDELFDSSLDNTSTELAIRLLDIISRDTCCFIISHKSDLFESKMDRIIQLSLKNNFTRVQEIV